MRLELWMLLSASLLGLVHIAAASFTFKAQVGNRYTVGARDENLQPSGTAGRMFRAQQNFMETYPIFAVCVVLTHLTDSYGIFSLSGSILYLFGRTLFLPLYAIGVPWLRTISWNIATLGLVLVGAQILVAHP
jgi:uncharacterized MAPEG superfamily protein